MVASYSYVLEDLKALLCHELQTLVERFGSCEKVRRPAGSRSSTHPIDGAGDRNRGNDSACRVSGREPRRWRHRAHVRPRSVPSRAGEPRAALVRRTTHRRGRSVGVCGSAHARRTLAPDPAVHRQSGSDEHRVTQGRSVVPSTRRRCVVCLRDGTAGRFRR